MTQDAKPAKSNLAMKVLLSLAIIGVVVAVLAMGALAGGYYALNHLYQKAGPAEEDRLFTVEQGATLRGIAEQLERDGMISDARVMRLAIRLHGDSTGLQAGEYLIPAGASIAAIYQQLSLGDVETYAITFPEGWRTDQIVARLNANPDLSGDPIDIDALTIEHGQLKQGWLLPDTYSFKRGASRQSILDRMERARTQLLDELWDERADGLPFDTHDEAIVLASIVDKEAGGSEHDLVAGVLINRLMCPQGQGTCAGRAWRLEVDATVHFGVNGGQPLFNARGQRRTLYRSELDNAGNAFNTYLIDGLPPGPITNPGRAAIAAVLNPAQTDAMYFVADGTGGHAFARTYREHQSNVARWRQIEDERIAQERADDS